ncbi:iron-containing alcohol dehydrogenase [Oceanirhabdus sp. W0125-5]|uniref:iron-containing alcohol dehydrogenase n=1 Tax=Oceanirhabdus sp. W0125-5 TaxID=2999116 RepID=UPI0022F2D387|nr:iron-containing alcohol dehydrogenase [Oceanirhabdus sp. W0125-5]WBW97352.1 iron-containing alcohol dehydrogenase [Oceanirhabdus sp. W0125-5]
MNKFHYFMPTEILCNQDVVRENSIIFKSLGNKACIMTGANSSKKNGSLNDTIYSLEKENIEYIVFDSVEENPTLENIINAFNRVKEEQIDFIIGIGGGSPIDASKALAILLKNPDMDPYEIFEISNLDSIPVVAIPTTAGTGTETTPYAILTDNRVGTKRNFNQKVFPKYALLDPSYLIGTPDEITINTAIDALSHLIEGYLSVDANLFSDFTAEKGFDLFNDCVDSLIANDFPYAIRERIMLASTLAGVVISQAGTSLPHGMGYPLTYHHKIPHGKANGLLLKAYLNFCYENLNLRSKVETILDLLEFDTIDQFGQFIKQIMPNNCNISESDLRKYTLSMMKNEGKLKKHEGLVEEKDIYEIYINSLTL